ncbi:hypothetical protein CA13_53040 [Planctomycetes bacterium CA13]|uniref:Uncharacterized protein n=1 Tax=Novipirellula herctigrandis TaxID=2527986 RepID=A0A5C5Z932_9BACT|nr:hypothetical protein CA13_53040 [Planctomycetes bacterium CA13]
MSTADHYDWKRTYAQYVNFPDSENLPGVDSVDPSLSPAPRTFPHFGAEHFQHPIHSETESAGLGEDGT